MVVFIRLPTRIKHLNNEHGDLETLARRLVVVFVSIRSYNFYCIIYLYYILTYNKLYFVARGNVITMYTSYIVALM